MIESYSLKNIKIFLISNGWHIWINIHVVFLFLWYELQSNIDNISGASSVSKREVPPSSERLDSIGQCYPTPDWSNVAGMDQWCSSNCKTGTNDAACPVTHCHCPTEGTPVKHVHHTLIHTYYCKYLVYNTVYLLISNSCL